MSATLQECEEQLQDLQDLMSGETLGVLGDQGASDWQSELVSMQQELDKLSWAMLDRVGLWERQADFRATYREGDKSYSDFDAEYFSTPLCKKHNVTDNYKCRTVIDGLKGDAEQAEDKVELEALRGDYSKARDTALPGYLDEFEQHFGLSLDAIKTYRAEVLPSTHDGKAAKRGELLDQYKAHCMEIIERLQGQIASAQAAGLERTVSAAPAVGGASSSAKNPDFSLVLKEGHEEGEELGEEGPELAGSSGSPASPVSAPAAVGGASPVGETVGLMGGGASPSSLSSSSFPPMQLEASAETHSGRGMGGVFVGVVITLVTAAVGVLAGAGIGLGVTGSNITGLATLGTFLGGAGLPYVLVGGIIFGVLGLVGARMTGRTRSGDDAPADNTEYAPLAVSGADSPAEVRSATQPLVSPSSPQVAAPSGQRERAEGSLSPRASQSPTPGGGESN